MDRRNTKDKKEYIQKVYCIHMAAAQGVDVPKEKIMPKLTITE